MPAKMPYGESQRRVLAEIIEQFDAGNPHGAARRDIWTALALSEEGGLTTGQIHSALQHLKRRGKIVKSVHGGWVANADVAGAEP